MTPRFARVVERSGIANEPCVEKATMMTLKLLQREHAAVVRKVKAMHKKTHNQYYAEACADLLAWLNKRGR